MQEYVQKSIRTTRPFSLETSSSPLWSDVPPSAVRRAAATIARRSDV